MIFSSSLSLFYIMLCWRVVNDLVCILSPAVKVVLLLVLMLPKIRWNEAIQMEQYGWSVHGDTVCHVNELRMLLLKSKEGLSSKVSSFLNPMPAHRKLSVSWQNVNRAHAQQICPASLGAIMNWRGSKMKKHIFRQIHILVIVLLSLHHCGAKVSDERLCADPECNSKFSFCLHTCLVLLGRSLHRF